MQSIQFGRKKALNITRESLINMIELKFRSLTNEDIWAPAYNLLKEYPELKTDTKFSFSTNGHRGLLFFTTLNGKQFICFVYKKKKELIKLRMRFDEKVFKNSIIEGEMHRDDMGRIIFGVSDLWYDCGKNIMTQSLENRLKALKKFFDEKYVSDDYLDPFYFYIKPWTNDIETIKHIINRLNFNCIGVSIKSLRRRNGPETIYLISDLKRTIKNNIILNATIGKDPDVYYLFCYRGTTLYKLGRAYIPDLKTSTLMSKWFKHKDSQLLECVWSPDFSKWKPIKIVNSGESIPISHYDTVQKAQTS